MTNAQLKQAPPETQAAFFSSTGGVLGAACQNDVYLERRMTLSDLPE